MSHENRFDIYDSLPMRAALGLFSGHRPPGGSEPTYTDVTSDERPDYVPKWEYSEEEREDDTF